ncbi:MAG TPA: hypothetical protein VFK05_30065 [Polyangiaceae bacterium]|nr:hypothetical protein [Polyangiaceae bacterium]
MFYRLATGIFTFALFAAGCASQAGDAAPEGEPGVEHEALSKCGYPPRRPPGCTVQCVCTDPIGPDWKPYCYWDYTCPPPPVLTQG